MITALRGSDLSFETRSPARPRPETAFARSPAQAANHAPATNIHPVAVATPLAAAAWFILVSWAAFAGGETSLILAVITFLALIFFGLLVGGAAMARDMTPDRAHRRSFREFLEGDVDIATGHVSGREALLQIAAMPVALALGSTAIALIAVCL